MRLQNPQKLPVECLIENKNETYPITTYDDLGKLSYPSMICASYTYFHQSYGRGVLTY